MSEHTHGEYEITEKQQRYFTPTTEEVLKGYASALYLSDVPRDRAAEFDRWIIQERKRVADMATKKERRRAMSIIMTNIGQIVWQAKHNPETDAIDMTKIYEEIMGEDND